MSYLETLRQQGFDESRHIPFTKWYRPKCSRCESLVICGVATHERGCSNETYECRGCNVYINHRGYCSDCQ